MPRSAPPVQKISQRLHVTQDLGRGNSSFGRQTKRIICAMYCASRLGAQILFFNGRDGEWLGRINDIGKKRSALN